MRRLSAALLDAAVSGDAFNTDTLAAVLRPMTSLSEIMDEKTGKGTGRFRPTVEFPDTDPNTGEPIVVKHTPQSAVKRMKELPKYVNLFKSGVVGGAGANAGGLTPGSDGKFDVRAATADMATYMAIRASDPAKLGLRPSRRASIVKAFCREASACGELFARARPFQCGRLSPAGCNRICALATGMIVVKPPGLLGLSNSFQPLLVESL